MGVRPHFKETSARHEGLKKQKKPESMLPGSEKQGQGVKKNRGSKKQGGGSKKQGGGSKKQGGGSKKQGGGSKKQGGGSKKQGARLVGHVNCDQLAMFHGTYKPMLATIQTTLRFFQVLVVFCLRLRASQRSSFHNVSANE